MATGKTYPELTAAIDVAATDLLASYRAPGPVKQVTALLVADYVGATITTTGKVPVFQLKANAEASTILATVGAIQTLGYVAPGVGGANYVRTSYATIVSDAYPLAAYFRSVDRFMPDGSTDATNGGYWLLTETFVSPEMFGAVGDGVTLDVAALLAMIAAAGVGGVMHLSPGKTYLIDRNITTLTGQRLVGNGGVLKRAAQVVTTTTSAITATVTTSVDVTSATGFAIGQTIAFATVGVARSAVVYGTSLSQPITITNIVGNTLTLNQAPTITSATGATCFLTFASLILGEGSIVDGVEFDGNRANWTYSRWEVTQEISTLNSGGLTNNQRVKNCVFRDAPGEAVLPYGGNLEISGNRYFDIGGNAIHLSGVINATIFNEQGVTGNIDTAVGHADGFISFSNGNAHVRMYDLYAEEFIAGIGAMNNTDADLTAENCDFVNMYCFGIEGGAGVSGLKFQSIRIAGVATDITKKTGSPYYGGMVFVQLSASDYVFDNITVTGVTVGANNKSVALSGTGSASHEIRLTGGYFEGDAIFGGLNGYVYLDNDYVGGNVSMGAGIGGQFAGGSITPTAAQLAFNMTSNVYENLDLLEGTTITGGAYGISVGTSITSMKGVTFGRATLYDQTTRAVNISAAASAVVSGACFAGTVIRTGPNSGASFVGIYDNEEGYRFQGVRLINDQGSSSRTAIRTADLALAPLTVVKDCIVEGAWLYSLILATSSGMFGINNVLSSAETNPTGNNITGTIIVV